MRTFVDLPPAVHQRVAEIAQRQGTSLSAVLADLVTRGLAQLSEPLAVATDEFSGFPVVSVGRRVTAQDVAALLDEE